MSLKKAMIGLGLIAVGCAHDGAGDLPRASVLGPPVASYPLPPEVPKGTVHVTSLGIERLPADGPAYWHLRIAAVNASDDVGWRVDPNEQVLSFEGAAGRRELPPDFAEASDGEWELTLARGERGYLDVYYAVTADAPGAFTLSWKVHRGAAAAAYATPFDRKEAPGTRYAYYRAADSEASFGYAASSWWWHDYYFWGRGGDCWWPYRRTHFHHWYPSVHPALGRPVGPDHGRGAPLEPPRPSWPDAEASQWRGGDHDRRERETSAWRNPPDPSPAPASQDSSSAPPSSSSGGGGGDGKSSWRGGSGP